MADKSGIIYYNDPWCQKSQGPKGQDLGNFLHDFLKCTLPTRVVGPGSDKLCGTWVRQALWDQVYFYFRGAKICINSHRIPGFASLLQTHLMRGSLKGFAQLAIGHNQRGDPPPPPGEAMYSWFELSPRNNPSDWSRMEFQ